MNNFYWISKTWIYIKLHRWYVLVISFEKTLPQQLTISSRWLRFMCVCVTSDRSNVCYVPQFWKPLDVKLLNVTMAIHHAQCWNDFMLFDFTLRKREFFTSHCLVLLILNYYIYLLKGYKVFLVKCIENISFVY